MKKHGEEEEEEEGMDWYSWLSKSSLDPSDVYEYGLAFTRNELKDEDLRYFNHEFLQSMGISVAKHRLEILKLARNKEGGLSRFVTKTKKLLARNITKLLLPHHRHRNDNQLSHYRAAALCRPCKRLMNSGPLDSRKVVHEKMAITSMSGPLDAKLQDRLMLPSCSPLPWGGQLMMKERMVFPTISPISKSGPLDAWTLVTPNPADTNRPHSLWSLMFQDMKPT